VSGSVSIEGFSVTEDEAAAIVSGARAPDASGHDEMAVACYAHAMDHVGTLAIDPVFQWTDRALLDLHYDACSFQTDKSPGLWRTDAIAVTDPRGRSAPAYVGPDAGEVVALIDEVLGRLQHGDLDAHVAVRSAMAHLHVVSGHPFRDGNGRISRIVQSLVLARDGLRAPELSSIEEYLGANTGAYHAVLQQAQGGGYRPELDATPWIRFCLGAHIEQAQRRLEQLRQAGARWASLEQLVAERGWPDRLVIALEQSLLAGVDRAGYVEEAGVSAATATKASAGWRTPAWSSSRVERGARGTSRRQSCARASAPRAVRCAHVRSPRVRDDPLRRRRSRRHHHAQPAAAAEHDRAADARRGGGGGGARDARRGGEGDRGPRRGAGLLRRV
jgi:Fic family protein